MSSASTRQVCFFTTTSSAYQLATRLWPMSAPTPGKAAPQPKRRSSPPRSSVPATGSARTRTWPGSGTSLPPRTVPQAREKAFHSPTLLDRTRFPVSTAKSARPSLNACPASLAISSAALESNTRPFVSSPGSGGRSAPSTAKPIGSSYDFTAPSSA